MATNKNAQLRYKILDRCFKNILKRYSVDDLLDEVNGKLMDINGVGISDRQIREDIKFMRDSAGFNANILAIPFEGKKCYYRYANPDFSIYKSELSDEELSKLHCTIEMLGRYRGGGNEWLEEVITSLEYKFGVKPN